MKGWTAVLLFLGYPAVVFGLLYGMLVLLGHLGLGEHATTLVAALGGALVGSLGPVLTAVLTTVGERRNVEERIHDEASRVALEQTRMDYDLRRESVTTEVFREVLAPVKVYREVYLAVVELRTKGSWPASIEALGLLNVFRVRTKQTRSGPLKESLYGPREFVALTLVQIVEGVSDAQEKVKDLGAHVNPRLIEVEWVRAAFVRQPP